jgi:hypothetical protein
MSVKVEHLSSRGEELGLFASVAGVLAAVGMAVTCLRGMTRNVPQGKAAHFWGSVSTDWSRSESFTKVTGIHVPTSDTARR